MTEKLLPPDDPNAFEDLCCDLFRMIWNDPNTQRNGRTGQEQAGVDVFGKENGQWVGVQCKQKSLLLRRKLTKKELEDEVENAKGFKPKLASFILATTGPRDQKIQTQARALDDDASIPFRVAVWSWDDLWPEIKHPDRWDHLRQFFPLQSDRQKVAVSRLPKTSGTKLFGRDDELSALDELWVDSTKNVLTVVAFGGVGKTALLETWTSRLAARDYDGADYFDWSFYSQGTSDRTSASADSFLNEALNFFGVAVEATESAWNKGAKLAGHLAERRALLVLDGLEPMQYPPGPLEGELKDPGLQALLKGLSQRNAGLCVVTTRERVQDLAARRETTAPGWELKYLSTDAGVELLHSLGVNDFRNEAEKLVKEVKGHALTLNLVGRYLVQAHQGDVRRRDRIQLQRADATFQGGHAFKAIEAYETWLAEGGEPGQRQLALLRLLSLFDRPAEPGCIAALRQPPAIDGLTDQLIDLDEDDWHITLSQLQTAGLLTAYEDGTLDAHPLVREYFAKQLQEQHSQAWKAAHGSLFDHLKNTTEHQPDTLEELQPLYQAVVHGCLAERYIEALGGANYSGDGIYIDRILRGTGPAGHYSVRKLGVFGADLGAVACFFDPPWKRVTPSLTEANQGWLLNNAATYLRALSRLREAVEPMRAGLEMAAEQEDWKNAAINASNLSELELTLGDIAQAVADAEQSVTFADRSEDANWATITRTKVAVALHQAGHQGEAKARFEEAERTQAEMSPDCPRLYSLRGFRYCDLLLDTAAHVDHGNEPYDHEAVCREAEDRAKEALEIALQNHLSILTIALDHLTLGRARLIRALLTGNTPHAAIEPIEQAIDGLRRAGQLQYQPLGLLTRAHLRHTLGEPDDARADLVEAEEIASRGPMPLHLADIALMRARLFDDRDALATADSLIKKHGYNRRLPELEELTARLA